MKKHVTTTLLGLMIAAALTLTGCARNVSGSGSTDLLRFSLTITFDGTPDMSRYNYYIFFSTTNNPVVPETLPLEYFFTPGRNFDPSQLNPTQDDISRYYTDFFSTWSDYLVFTGASSADLYNSNATQFDANTTDNSDYDKRDGFTADSVQISGDTLTLQFTLQSLSQNLASGDTLFFTIATTDKDSTFTESGTLIDILQNSNPSISIPSEPGPFNDDTLDATEDPKANILSWEARIF